MTATMLKPEKWGLLSAHGLGDFSYGFIDFFLSALRFYVRMVKKKRERGGKKYHKS